MAKITRIKASDGPTKPEAQDEPTITREKVVVEDKKSKKSEKAKQNAEMLGLMVNEPHIEPSELARLTMPVLVVAGTKDMIKESHTRLIYKSLPNAQMNIIEGDHFVANKNAEAFNKVVDIFLRK